MEVKKIVWYVYYGSDVSQEHITKMWVAYALHYLTC